MPIYDYYEPYRPALTEEEKKHLGYAAIADQDLIDRFRMEAPNWTPEKNSTPGFFTGPDNKTYYNQVTKLHIEIATRQAKEQLKRQNTPMPEEEETTLRFPGTSPKDKYSLIDMKLAQRWNDIEAENPFHAPQTAAYITALKVNPFYKETAEKVAQISNQHRVLTRATKLCRDEEGQQLLHDKARALENDPCVVQMNQILEGMEYLQGKRQDVSQDIKNLYKNNMGIDLEHTRNTINTMEVIPETIDVKFDNLDDIIQQRAFSNPRNWNRSAAEMKAFPPAANEVDTTIRPYATATVKLQLTPAFERMKKANIDFRDLVIVDGKSIQEHFNEMENVPSNKEAAENYASMMIASALMSGKRVDVFVPTPDGKLPEKPSAVEARGYAPQNSGPVVLNAWERFASRFGFYKEKVAQAEEYKRAMEARTRVLPNIEKRAAQKMENSVPDMKKMFFGGLDAELAEAADANGKLANDKKIPNLTRTSPVSACICIMARKYRLEDILDPDKLKDEKQRYARYYLDMVKIGDITCLGAELADGTVALQEQMNRISQNTDFGDPVRRAATLPTLSAAAYAGFDIYQDVQNNEKLLEAYSGALLETDRATVTDHDKKIRYGVPRLEEFKTAYTVCSALEKAAIAKENLGKSDLSYNTALHDVTNLVVGDLALRAIHRGVPLHECAFNTEAQVIFTAQLAQQKEVIGVAKAISENPKARAALQQMLTTTPMSRALQVNTAEALTNPNEHGGVRQATEKIITDTKVTMAEDMKNVLNAKTVQAAQPRL